MFFQLAKEYFSLANLKDITLDSKTQNSIVLIATTGVPLANERTRLNRVMSIYTDMTSANT